MESLCPGRPLRASKACREPRLCAPDGRHACAGNWRELRDLQRRQRRHSQPAGLSGARPTDVHHQPVSGSRVRSVLGFCARVSRVPGLEPRFRFRRCLQRPGEPISEPTSRRARPRRSSRASSCRRWVSRPRMGRLFTLEDTLPGAEDVAILSDGLWRSKLQRRPGDSGPKRRRSTACRPESSGSCRRATTSTARKSSCGCR